VRRTAPPRQRLPLQSAGLRLHQVVLPRTADEEPHRLVLFAIRDRLDCLAHVPEFRLKRKKPLGEDRQSPAIINDDRKKALCVLPCLQRTREGFQTPQGVAAGIAQNALFSV
jgi:hypothetical protein